MSARDADGLIIPRKVSNPCLESPSARDLTRQIKWNAKAGVNVLNKSELERVLDRQRRLHSVKERQEETEETPFQKMLTERAKRLEQIERNDEAEKRMNMNNLNLNNLHLSNSSIMQKSSVFEQVVSSKGRKLSETPRAANKADTKTDLRKTQSHEAKLGQSSWEQKSKEQSSLEQKSKEQSSWERKNTEQLSWDAGKKEQRSKDNWEPRNKEPSLWEQRQSKERSKNWDGNSSGSSSKSSSPEPESEFLKVFAQLRGSKSTET